MIAELFYPKELKESNAGLLAKRDLKRFIYFLAFFVVIAISACRPSSADGYKYVSGDFKAAIEQITADYFFDPDYPPKPVMRGRNAITRMTPKEYYQKDSLLLYEKLGKRLCEDITSSYNSILESGISGEGAYAFDEELLKFMRKQGAYALPLRVFDSHIYADYTNAEWLEGANTKEDTKKLESYTSDYINYFKDHGIHNRYALLKQNTEKNSIRTYARASQYGTGNYSGFSISHQYMQNHTDLKLYSFDGKFRFQRSFLFVFDKDPDDVSAESIYFYVFLPYYVTMDELGQINALSLYDGKGQRKADSAHCEVSSKIVVQKIKHAMMPIVDLEPLTLPVHKDYARHEIYEDIDTKEKDVVRSGISKKTKRILNDPYSIEAKDMTEPSLRCWNLTFGFDQGDIKSCLNTGYATEFLEMLNRNVCIDENGIRKPPSVGFPYTAKPGVLYPNTPLYNKFANRCNPEPLRQGK